MPGKAIGKVSHYYDKIGVAVVDLTGGLNVGDAIAIVGKDGSVSQDVESMQIDGKQVQSAGAKQSIGLKVSARVRNGDTVLKL